jgi:hypothetical protein
MSGEDKDAGADGAADPEADEIERGQCTLGRMSGAVLLRGLFSQGGSRFSGPEIYQVLSILSDARRSGSFRRRRRDKAV